MSKISGIDIKQFYKPDLYAQQGDKRYSDHEIARYYSRFAKQCKEHEVRFSTCYIGNGIKDYYQYQKLWTNKSDCCDAKGNVKKICGPTSQKVSWDTRIKHAPCKKSALESQKSEEEADLAIPRMPASQAEQPNV